LENLILEIFMTDDQNEQRKLIVEIWKVIIEVQQHFNDISMRIRSMFITILLGLLASIGFLLDKRLNLQVCFVNIQFATLMPVFGMFGAYLFYFIDRYWYHRLLIGAVKHAIVIEGKYKDEIPELALTDAIGRESPYEPRGPARWFAKLFVNDERYRNTGKLHSDGKIEFFYKSVMLALLVITIVLAGLGGVTFDKKTPAPASPSTTTTAPAPPSSATPAGKTLPAPTLPLNKKTE
jgi:hypothetical protein